MITADAQPNLSAIPPELHYAITLLREQMHHLDPHTRREIFSAVRAGYCHECGSVSPDERGRRCQCWNDE